MEALDRSVKRDVLDAATPELRQLLGVELRYPELLEEADAGNAEGRSA